MHEQIPFIQWACRKDPNSTTRIAPFQLLYGGAPKCSLSILKSSWEGEEMGEQLDTIPINEYLNKFMEFLKRAKNEAKLSSEVLQGKMTYH